MKIKSSTILQTALDSIRSGKQSFACAAIADAETQLRWDNKQEIQSKAMQVFSKQMPATVRQDIRLYGEWWPKGSSLRVEALERALAEALKNKD